eukprot:scaffold125740_cov50-Attheya_sp.AAC.3
MPPVEPRWLFFFFVIFFVVGEGGVVLHFEAFECVLGNFVAFSLAQDVLNGTHALLDLVAAIGLGQVHALASTLGRLREQHVAFLVQHKPETVQIVKTLSPQFAYAPRPTHHFRLPRFVRRRIHERIQRRCRKRISRRPTRTRKPSRLIIPNSIIYDSEWQSPWDDI